MILFNFQTLLTYDQMDWLLHHWIGNEVAGCIAPIMRSSVVLYEENIYRYKEDIRIWEKLELHGGISASLQIIILRFFGDSLYQWRKMIGGQIYDDPKLMESHGETINKIYDGKLPALNWMLYTVKMGITVDLTFDLTRMHFVNGSYKIEDGLFRNLEEDGRVKEDYIMDCISYPFYRPENETELQQGFLNVMAAIFPEPGALDYILLTFVRAILGEQTNHFMYFYGSGNVLLTIYNNFLTNNTFFFIMYRI